MSLVTTAAIMVTETPARTLCPSAPVGSSMSGSSSGSGGRRDTGGANVPRPTRSSWELPRGTSLEADDGADAAEEDEPRRSFFRACSRKSLESGPEDEEFVVGDDGTIAVVAIDDRARIERLGQLLERKERETRQAAEYGLSLLATNEELELQVAALKIQLESEGADLTAERELYRRRYENALQETETWKRKHARAEEEREQLRSEFERRLRPSEHGHLAPHEYERQQQRIAELETQLVELHQSDAASAAVIEALREWKAAVESQQRAEANAEALETSSRRVYVEKLEADVSKLRQTVDGLGADKQHLEARVAASEAMIRRLQQEVDNLHEDVAAKRRENHAQMELLHTSESRCSRLQRELALMEHVSYLSMAVIDHDDEEDDDEDDEQEADGDTTEDEENEGDDNAVVGAVSVETSGGCADNNNRDDEANATTSKHIDVPPQGGSRRPSVASHVRRVSDDEDWFTPRRSDTAAATRRRRASTVTGSALPPYHLPGSEQVVPSTPSSMATHQKLHHYFHLTALSIIHENDLHELCFSSSSRFTIDTWYREIVDEGIPFLEWHSWLINRISAVAATMQLAQSPTKPPTGPWRRNSHHPSAPSSSSSSSSSSPFSSVFARRRSSTRRAGSMFLPPMMGNAAPSPTGSSGTGPGRVPFSVARSFFRLLGRRDRHAHEQDPPQTA